MKTVLVIIFLTVSLFGEIFSNSNYLLEISKKTEATKTTDNLSNQNKSAIRLTTIDSNSANAILTVLESNSYDTISAITISESLNIIKTLYNIKNNKKEYSKQLTFLYSIKDNEEKLATFYSKLQGLLSDIKGK